MSAAALAEDQPGGGDELSRRYQDALTQLKAAQDRKNELAAENEKLTARVTDLEKQNQELARDKAGFAKATWRLRAEQAAWEAFLRRRPRLLETWRLFFSADPLAQPTTLPAALENAGDPLSAD